MRCSNSYILIVLTLPSICCSPLPATKSTLDSGKQDDNSIGALPRIVQNVRFYYWIRNVVSSRTNLGPIRTDMIFVFQTQKNQAASLYGTTPLSSVIPWRTPVDMSNHIALRQVPVEDAARLLQQYRQRSEAARKQDTTAAQGIIRQFHS